MSAYIVDKSHIVYLVAAAMSPALNRYSGTFRWFHASQYGELPCGDFERAAQVANMLWAENIKSVSARYPRETISELPGPIGELYEVNSRDIPVFGVKIESVQVLKACDCFEYQACEHDEWKTSASLAFIERLRSAAWHALPGYEEAAWGRAGAQTSSRVGGTRKTPRRLSDRARGETRGGCCLLQQGPPELAGRLGQYQDSGKRKQRAW